MEEREDEEESFWWRPTCHGCEMIAVLVRDPVRPDDLLRGGPMRFVF